jgi:hypothetical protein
MLATELYTNNSNLLTIGLPLLTLSVRHTADKPNSICFLSASLKLYKQSLSLTNPPQNLTILRNNPLLTNVGQKSVWIW